MLPQLLTRQYPTDKNLFLIPRFALSLIGFYPESPRTFWLYSLALFNFSILVYGCYAEFYYGVYYISIDVVKGLDALCPVASSILSLFKICCIWWYREDFKGLIQRVRFLTEQQNTAAKLEIKRKYFTLATRLTALVLFFGFCTSTSYSVRTILMNILRYSKGEDILYETPFKMIFPEVLLRMPIYPVTFLFVHWHGYITVVSFVGGDGFFLGFCLYFSTLLKSLQLDIKNLLSELPNNLNLDPARENEICRQLEELISRHNEIADMTTQLSKIMEELTLGHFVTSSIIIGTSVVDVMLFSGYGILVYVVYTCAVLTEIFLYCLGGTAVAESSVEVANVAYCSDWYSHSVKVQKMVLLMIGRAQRELAIKVPFFAPSLPALTAILRFTGSLIALANQIL